MSVYQRARRQVIRSLRCLRTEIAGASPEVKAAAILVAGEVLDGLIGKL